MQPLLGGPRVGLSEQDVAASLMPWHAPLIRHGVDVLDTRGAETGERAVVDWAAGGEVRWAFRSPAGPTDATSTPDAVRRTGRLVLVGPPTFPIEARRLRLWTEMLSPFGTWVRWHLGVFVAPPAAVRDDGTVVRRELELADLSYRYATRHLTDTLRVDAGADPVGIVRTVLATTFGDRDLVFPDSATLLAEPMTFESGTSWLAVFNALLGSVGLDALTVDEDGRPRTVPLASVSDRGPEMTYGPGTPIVTAGVVEPLLPTLPNVLRVVARQGPSLPEVGNGIAIRRNENTGPGSVRARGGEEVLEIVEVDADAQPALEAAADAEAQRRFAGGGLRFSGQVGLNPRFSDQDVIALDRPRLALLGGVWQVTGWTYPLQAVSGDGSVLMPITCEQRVDVSS